MRRLERLGHGSADDHLAPDPLRALDVKLTQFLADELPLSHLAGPVLASAYFRSGSPTYQRGSPQLGAPGATKGQSRLRAWARFRAEQRRHHGPRGARRDTKAGPVGR